jgi:hypothetical protein
VPSNLDIVRAPENIDTMKETEMIMSSTTLRVVELHEQQAVKVLSQFADVHFCLFAIDLTCYDRYLDDRARTNEFEDRLASLKRICRSSFFSKSIILLLLTNATAFRERIALSPIKPHFDDYKGGNNFGAATKYILKSCRKVNRTSLQFFWHIHDEEDAEAVAMDQFFRQAAESMSWLKEIAM